MLGLHNLNWSLYQVMRIERRKSNSRKNKTKATKIKGKKSDAVKKETIPV